MRTGNCVEDFEAHRHHLRAVAYHILGSATEADDAVQEAWLRAARADTEGIQNARAWLTTVVARICLDMLRLRASRREVPLGAPLAGGRADPEQEAVLAESVGIALLVVLDTLRPAERLAFVLHDVFDVHFADIAPIIGRWTHATKMLASRARHRVPSAQNPTPIHPGSGRSPIGNTDQRARQYQVQDEYPGRQAGLRDRGPTPRPPATAGRAARLRGVRLDRGPIRVHRGGRPDALPGAVTRAFEKLAFDADLPPIRLHDLRHSAPSTMHAAGVDIVTISRTLGHSILAITSDSYTSVFENVDEAAAEATAAVR